MKKMAVLDLGTNTFHLHIAHVKETDFETVFKMQIPVKLGEGGINQGHIGEGAYKRGIEAMKDFAAELKNYEVELIRAFATSAIRDASNGLHFMEEVKRHTQIEIDTITGEQEALLIYEGVRHSLPFSSEPKLIMDIGGGSVEFIIANQTNVFWKQSFRLGAARLIEKYHRHDPMGKEECSGLYEYLRAQLTPLWEALSQFPVTDLVGSAGSFESVVELIGDLLQKPVQKFSAKSHLVELDDFFQIHPILLKSTAAERKKMKGLVSFRVEMMVAASCLIDVVLKHARIRRLLASEYSLKEGVFFSEKN